jgi:arylsulfatase A-like enzyme
LRRLLLLLALTFVAGLPPLGRAAAAARAKPNAVLILADDLGYGELGAYGGRQIPTPNLDALARGGVQFTDGYASAPQCAPTRAGLMTGRYQQRFGFYNNPPPRDHPAWVRFGLPTGEVTLAEELKRQGYATGLVGKWHLGFKPEQHPRRRGFDEFFGFLDGGHAYRGETPGVPLYRNFRVVEESQYLTRAFARESVAFVRRNADRPFFLYAAFNATHLPLQAEPAMLARFAHIADVKRRTFAAMLATLDEAVGDIVRAIRAEGLDRDTLVVFLTDNGCNLQSTCRNAPLRAGKGLLYEGGIRVPFLLSWPGTVPSGQRFGRPVVALDLFPTFLAAATGRDYANPRLDGVNLLPFVTGRVTGAPHDRLFWGGRSAGAVRRGDWKLHVPLPPQPVQLYNLRQDIAETRNQAASQPGLVAELRRVRDAWARTLPPPLWPAE